MKGLMSNMNRFCSKTNYDFNRKIKTIRRIYYGEERVKCKKILKRITENIWT